MWFTRIIDCIPNPFFRGDPNWLQSSKKYHIYKSQYMPSVSRLTRAAKSGWWQKSYLCQICSYGTTHTVLRYLGAENEKQLYVWWPRYVCLRRDAAALGAWILCISDSLTEIFIFKFCPVVLGEKVPWLNLKKIIHKLGLDLPNILRWWFDIFNVLIFLSVL